MAKRILLTGGSGFVGQEILLALSNSTHQPPYDISVLDILPLPSSLLESTPIRFFHADITDASAVLTAIRAAKPDLVIHTAGYVPTRYGRYDQSQREKTFRVNVEGTRNVLAAVRECGVGAVVYTSSVTTITDDTGHDYPNVDEDVAFPDAKLSLVYGESKAIAESLILSANTPHLRTCALRPSTLYGIGDYQLIPTIHGCIEKGETPYIVGSGLNLYDFSFVTNIADAHVLAVENLLGSGTAAGEAFFISNGQPVPFRAFCLAIWAHFGHFPPWEVRVPKGLAWGMGLAAEIGTMITRKPVTLSRGSVRDACQTAYASIEKARRVLGYRPRYGLTESLEISCKDYQRRLENGEGVPRP